jgi:outer membrane protein TolC
MRKLIIISLTSLSCLSHVESKQFLSANNAINSSFRSHSLHYCNQDSFYKVEDLLLNNLLKYAYYNNIDLLLLRDSLDLNNCLPKDFISIQEERQKWQTLSKQIIVTYLNLRVVQQKNVFLDKNIENQNQVITLINDLLQKGQSDSITLANAEANLNKLLALKIDLNQTEESLIANLSNLLSVSTCHLINSLKIATDLPRICSYPSKLSTIDSLYKRPDIQKALWQLNKQNSFQTKLLYRQAYIQAFNEINDAKATLKNNEKKSIVLNKAFYELLEAYNLTTDLHKRGLKDSFELINTNNQMIEAQISYIESKAEVLLSFISLNHAIGSTIDFCHR